MAREFDPIKGQRPDADIICKDCMFRDKTEIELCGKVVHSGVTKDTCIVFTDGLFKPSDVLFAHAPCEFYVKDDT